VADVGCSVGLRYGHQWQLEKHSEWGLYFAENSSKSNQYVDCPSCGYGSIHSKTCGKCSCTVQLEKAVSEQRWEGNDNWKGHYAMILCRVFLGRPYMVKRDEIKLYKNSTKSPFKENIQCHFLYLQNHQRATKK